MSLLVLSPVAVIWCSGSRGSPLASQEPAISAAPRSRRGTMECTKCVVFLFFVFLHSVAPADPAAAAGPGACTMELQCAECVPDNMPLVTSHRARSGVLAVPAGEELVLSCGAGRFLAYPLHAELTARCEAGRYRLPGDPQPRPLLHLGCQENVFEDVLHTVEQCAPPLQGRAYQTQAQAGGGGGGTRHLALLCYDEDRAAPTFARLLRAPLPPHSDHKAPLTLFGNFNHMFDSTTRHTAERLYSDDVRMNRRLHELFKHDKFTFADQTITGAPLLSELYFEDQDMRVAEFASNRVAMWRSVARGNLRHMQRDIAGLIEASGRRASLDVYCGTHGTMALRSGHERREVYLKASRFPVPKYMWAVVVEGERALALAVLNDPFVSVSEVRAAVFCESECGRVPWLTELRRHRNYETPLYGLTFCCHLHNFTSVVHEVPRALLRQVHRDHRGLLTELSSS